MPLEASPSTWVSSPVTSTLTTHREPVNCVSVDSISLIESGAQ